MTHTKKHFRQTLGDQQALTTFSELLGQNSSYLLLRTSNCKTSDLRTNVLPDSSQRTCGKRIKIVESSLYCL